MPEIVQEIGAYAGLAAVAGLAVLSVLYFSQARDVKRLREWAGRAPERSADTGIQAAPVPGRVQAQPQPKPAQAGAVPQPGQATPQPGQAKPGQAPPGPGAPQPAKPGTPQPGKPQPAPGSGQPPQPQPGKPQPGVPQPAPGTGQPGGPQPAPGTDQPSRADEAEPGKAPAAPRPGAPAIAASAGAGAVAATQAKPDQAPAQGDNAKPAVKSDDGGTPTPTGPGGPATPAGGRPPGAPPVPPPVAPSRPGQRAPVRPMLPPRPMPQQTQIIKPPREPWYRRLLANPRYLVLAVAGVLILGGAGAFGISELSKDDTGEPAGSAPAPSGNGGDEAPADNDQPNRPRIVPSSVTVAVLNGTTVPNLALSVAEEAEAIGFEVGTVANTADQEQQRAESVVLYAPGHEREATAVGRRLSINQRQPIDPASQEVAGDATVVVIAGADRSQ